MSFDGGTSFPQNAYSNDSMEPQQELPELFWCTQCDYKSASRKAMEQHVDFANAVPRVLITCPACKLLVLCLAVDLMGVGGHLDRCREAHSIGWLPGQYEWQRPETLQLLQSAMREAVSRTENGGMALLYRQEDGAAEYPEDRPVIPGPAGSSYDMPSGITGEMPTQGWMETDQSQASHEPVATGSENDVSRWIADHQQEFEDALAQATTELHHQPAQDPAASYDGHHQGGMMLHQDFTQAEASEYLEAGHIDDARQYSPLYFLPSPAFGAAWQQSTQNMDNTSHHDLTAINPFGTSLTAPTGFHNKSAPQFVNPYVGTNGSDSIDGFIRGRGGSKQVDADGQAPQDDDEEPEEETLAHKSAWQSRAVQSVEANVPAALLLPRAVESSSVAATPKLTLELQTKHIAPLATQPLDGKKKPAPKRSKHKAPSVLQAMKAARAAKSAQEASTLVQKQVVTPPTTSQETDTNHESVQHELFQEKSEQATAQPEMPQQTTRLQTPLTMPIPLLRPTQSQTAGSKKRRRDQKDADPSALEQLKKRRSNGEGKQAVVSVATRKITIIAGPKPKQVDISVPAALQTGMSMSPVQQQEPDEEAPSAPSSSLDPSLEELVVSEPGQYRLQEEAECSRAVGKRSTEENRSVDAAAKEMPQAGLGNRRMEDQDIRSDIPAASKLTAETAKRTKSQTSSVIDAGIQDGLAAITGVGAKRQDGAVGK